uniref:lipoprotein N-acyltransferase Lnb domain-containing protein n=1 Tax=Rhodoblastus sp. TaxID=1962975 RepID=UPI0035ADBF0B
MKRFAASLLAFLAALLVIAPLSLWSSLALWFRFPGPDWARPLTAALFAVFGLGVMAALFTPRRWRALAAFALAFAAMAGWWSTITPPKTGDWQPDVARQTTGAVDGDILTLSDVRDFSWRSEGDFTEHWAPQSYDLRKLKTLDLFLAYWAGPEMAHLIMSFGFEDGRKLSWSVEVRREKGSDFSPVADA